MDPRDVEGAGSRSCKEGARLMVYSHWLSPGSGQGQGPKPGRMGCVVIRRTFTLHLKRNMDLNRS